MQLPLASIAAGNMPVQLSHAAKLVCHVIPEQAFTGKDEFPSENMIGLVANLPIFEFTGGWTSRYNSNGMVTYDSTPNMTPAGYVQLYRNGVIESVADDITFFMPQDLKKSYRLFKTDLIRVIPGRLLKYLLCFQMMDIAPPAWLFISLIGMKGVSILPKDVFHSEGQPISEDPLMIPGEEIDDLSETNLKPLLTPIFNRLWNAAGLPQWPEA